MPDPYNTLHSSLFTKLNYLLLTFGCQMNKSDSQRIKTILDEMDLKETENEENADLIILNTCSVRQTAENRIYSFVQKFSLLREKLNKKIIIAVTGCMPGRDKDGKIEKRLSEVDLFFPIEKISEFPELLNSINPKLKTHPLEKDYFKITPKYQNSFQAFVPIQTGCNQFCTYCVVPYARGPEVNRSFSEIKKEIENFAQNGGKEITLLGQIVDKYEISNEEQKHLSKNNPYKTGFARLLYEVNQINGIERIHFTAPHPKYMNDEVIDALALPKHLNFLHIPIQSGSNEILKKMNRQHDRDHFINLIKKIKKRNPNICLGTDIIVGFSGETEKDFQDTIDLYKECEFDISYTAKYSLRSGTLAAKAFKDDITLKVKKERWFEVQKLMEDITYKRNQLFSEKYVSVLFDEYNSEKNIAMGWSREMKKVRVHSKKSLMGEIHNVFIKKAGVWILEGELKLEGESDSKLKII